MLMLPGPTDVPEETYAAMRKRLINHRDDAFRQLHSGLIDQLKRLLETRADVFLLTCSSTGGIEAAVSNMIERDDKVLSLRYGLFGDRMTQAASLYSDHVESVELPWGTAATLQVLRKALDEAGDVDVVLLVHNETSTGAFIPNIEELARECRRRGAYLIVDGVTSIGGVPIRLDALDIDVFVGGTQKCLAGPPGLSIVAVKERAWEKIEEKKRRPFYFDLLTHREFMERGETPFTPAITLFYGLGASLSRILDGGAERWYENHARGARAFYGAFDRMGIEIYPAMEFRSRTLIAVKTPDGILDREVTRRLAAKHDIHIGAGVSREKGRMLRIGNMGLVSAERIERTITGLGEVLEELGYKSSYREAAEGVWRHFRE